MGKRYISSMAICPFYRSEDTQKIYCEGEEVGTAIHVAFDTPAHKRLYVKANCYLFHCDCVVRRAHNKRYDDD